MAVSAVKAAGKPRFIDIGGSAVVIAVMVYLTALLSQLTSQTPYFVGDTVVARSTTLADGLSHVLERSRRAGVVSMIIMGGSLSESKLTLRFAKEHNLYATVGCHPTRSKEFENDPSGYLQALDDLVGTHLSGPGRVVAIGECGLDYDRTHFAPAAIQQKHFRSQLALAKITSLYSFILALRTSISFKYYVRKDLARMAGRPSVVEVVSFTVSQDQLRMPTTMCVPNQAHVIEVDPTERPIFSDHDGISFHIRFVLQQTEDNLATVKSIDRQRIMFETDAPWCSMTSTHASRRHIDTLPADLRELYLPPAVREEAFVTGRPVKGRNEPSAIGAVAWVAHKVKEEVSFHEFVEQGWRNTAELFGL
ncbi:hypothetical protein EDB84DRAFT_1560020 [Lactarius hengduanensis]|nr:hypothetical protein EDB84DRAFT_1560020 [Lactarius hengduanensis]